MPHRTVPDTDTSFALRDSRTRAMLVKAKQLSPAEAGRVREDAILLNRQLAQALARQYRGRGIEDEDLEQVAMLGLCKAVSGYQDEFDEVPFAAFAVPTITGELKRHFRDHGWLVRPTRSIQEVGRLIQAAIPILAQRLRRQPTRADLADFLGCPAATVDEAQLALGLYQGWSLDAPVRGTETRLGDTLQEACDVFAPVEAALTVGPAVAKLSGRERTILQLRFLEDLTQEQIGQVIGISQMQVSRSLTHILAKLRTQIEDLRAA